MRRVLDIDEERAISQEISRQDVKGSRYADEQVVFDRAVYYLERGLVLNVREAVKCGRAYERNIRHQKIRRNRQVA